MTEDIDNLKIRFVETESDKETASEDSEAVYEDNPYLGDFSDRVGARLAGLPKVDVWRALQREDEGRFSWRMLRRSYKQVLAVTAGAVLYAWIVYGSLHDLRSPAPAASAVPATAAMDR